MIERSRSKITAAHMRYLRNIEGISRRDRIGKLPGKIINITNNRSTRRETCRVGNRMGKGRISK